MTETQKAKALLAQYHAAKATYESPDPHDREERRYDNMNAARSRVEDVALVEALLAAVDDERAAGDAEGYARAMRDAADRALSVASSHGTKPASGYAEGAQDALHALADDLTRTAEVPRG